MEFTKEVIFMGVKDMTLRDGTLLHSVTFFVDGEAVTVNVLDTNGPVVSKLLMLEFTDKCLATFTLRKTDKLYRLSLTAISNV